MRAERIADMVARYVVSPNDEVTGVREDGDVVTVDTRRRWYEARPAEWRIAGAEWVAEAVRVVSLTSTPNFVATYGLVTGVDGSELFLNDVATMRALGGRLSGGTLAPLAYAELLAELYSVPDLSGPVVYPFAATESFRSGCLVEHVAAFLREYPWADPSLVAGPVVSGDRGRAEVVFHSWRYYLLEIESALDVYRWRVTAAPGEPVVWERTPVAERLVLPFPGR